MSRSSVIDDAGIQTLKQSNISVSGEKTIERVKAEWKAASADDKQAIENLSDVARATVARIYSTGSISAKMAVAIGLVLNIDPSYLTGESDERGECNDEVLYSFLLEKGYGDKIKKPSRNRGRIKKTEVDVNSSDEPQGEIDVPAPVASEAQTETASVESEASLDDMTEEEAANLLHSMYIRAKFNAKGAELLNQIKKLLVS